MEDYLKKLIPVIITADEYLQMSSLTDGQIMERAPMTKYKSINRPLCNYVSFEQKSTFLPFGQLSSLVEQPGISVVQFLAAQLYYKIQWKITNNSGIDNKQRVRYLTVDAEKQIAPEPWDIKGNRINMITPSPGKTTQGCFVVPGEYLYFLIEDPGRNLDIELSVTGYFPKLNNWAVYCGRSSDFCVKGRYMYTNSVSELTMIKRTLNPELLGFQERILEEYYRNAGQPCFLPSPQSAQMLIEETVRVTVEYNPVNNEFHPQTCFGNTCCGRSYIELSISLDRETDWITKSKDLHTIFSLKGGREYKMSNMLTSGSKVQNSYPFCISADYAFLLYPKDSEKEPQTFIRDKSVPPPLSPDAGDRISVIIDPTNLNSIVDNKNIYDGKYFTFDTRGSSNTDILPYAVRFNSPIWAIDETVGGIPIDTEIIYRPASFILTFDLTIFIPT